MTDAGQNWIGARSRDAASGDGFELTALAEPARVLGRWPRSGRADVIEALEAARSAAPLWRKTPRSERAHLLRVAARALDAAPDPRGAIAARLSLDASELAPHLAGVATVLERAIAEERAEPAATSGSIALHLPHWSEIVREPARRLFAALVAGRTVVLLSDPRLPMVSDAIAAALAASELLPGAWTLLHDDGATCLRELLAERDVDSLCASGARAELARLARESDSKRAQDLVALSNASHVVGVDGDPTSSAAEVLSSAFGRSRSLSGQAPGQIGRVLCHERVFSRFTEALLARESTRRGSATWASTRARRCSTRARSRARARSCSRTWIRSRGSPASRVRPRACA